MTTASSEDTDAPTDRTALLSTTKNNNNDGSSPNKLVHVTSDPPTTIYTKEDEEIGKTMNDYLQQDSFMSNFGGDNNGGNGMPTIRWWALQLSLWINFLITAVKLVAYVQTLSLSVLAALLDSVLDLVSQLVLNYTERHSSMQRSSAIYPAGASRLEPIGVLTCAALMGMASFEVLKESFTALVYRKSAFLVLDDDEGEIDPEENMASFWQMVAIVVVKLFLLWICNRGAHKKVVQPSSSGTSMNAASKQVVQLADPTVEALAQDHYNDALSNGVAAVALLCALRYPNLWFLDPVGAVLISLYIIYSWFETGREQIEHLTGVSAPQEFFDEIRTLASEFDERFTVDAIRAYHFGRRFLVEIEVVMHKETLLHESHDLGMDLQYEIEARPDVERCFVHIDYLPRPYDEHVVSKVPELREKYQKQSRSGSSSVGSRSTTDGLSHPSHKTG